MYSKTVNFLKRDEDVVPTSTKAWYSALSHT